MTRTTKIDADVLKHLRESQLGLAEVRLSIESTLRRNGVRRWLQGAVGIKPEFAEVVAVYLSDPWKARAEPTTLHTSPFSVRDCLKAVQDTLHKAHSMLFGQTSDYWASLTGAILDHGRYDDQEVVVLALSIH